MKRLFLVEGTCGVGKTTLIEAAAVAVIAERASEDAQEQIAHPAPVPTRDRAREVAMVARMEIAAIGGQLLRLSRFAPAPQDARGRGAEETAGFAQGADAEEPERSTFQLRGVTRGERGGGCEPRGVVDRASEHDGVVVVEVLDGVDGADVDGVACGEEPAGDGVRDALGGAVGSGVGDEDAGGWAPRALALHGGLHGLVRSIPRATRRSSLTAPSRRRSRAHRARRARQGGSARRP